MIKLLNLLKEGRKLTLVKNIREGQYWIYYPVNSELEDFRTNKGQRLGFHYYISTRDLRANISKVVNEPYGTFEKLIETLDRLDINHKVKEEVVPLPKGGEITRLYISIPISAVNIEDGNVQEQNVTGGGGPMGGQAHFTPGYGENYATPYAFKKKKKKKNKSSNSPTASLGGTSSKVYGMLGYKKAKNPKKSKIYDIEKWK